MSSDNSNPKVPAFLPFLALAAIVYISLIPFELRGRSLEQAVHIFRNISFLDLGIGSRADWVANILFYLPFGFLFFGWVTAKVKSSFSKIPLAVLVLATGTAVAVGMEFLQIFFAPRTVSLNDILAELIGITLGIISWELFRYFFLPVLHTLGSKGPLALRAGLILYIGLYLLMSFFPFDFLVSLEELAWKWDTGRVRILALTPGCDWELRCLFMKMAEVVAVMPFGVYLSLRWHDIDRKKYIRAFLFGALLGLVLESLQFFLASGVSQSFSILTRALGVMLGLWAWNVVREFVTSPRRLAAPPVKGLLCFLLLAYGIVVIKLYGWLDQDWLSWSRGWERLDGKMFIPFYYHYFSTETEAVMSILSNAALWAPLGFFIFLLGTSPSHWRSRGGTAALLAAVCTALLETGRLFLPGRHPDYSNLLIAAVSACFVAVVCYWVFRFGKKIDEQSGRLQTS